MTTQPSDAQSTEVQGPPTASYLRPTDVPGLLTREQQFAYVTLLSKGASPAAACAQLNIALADVIWSIDHDPQFEILLQRIQDLLSQNVAAALYRSAMEGSVTAQQYYLKNRPPPSWPTADSSSATTPDAEMTDDEFFEYFRTEAASLLNRLSKDPHAEA